MATDEGALRICVHLMLYVLDSRHTRELQTAEGSHSLDLAKQSVDVAAKGA